LKFQARYRPLLSWFTLIISDGNRVKKVGRLFRQTCFQQRLWTIPWFMTATGL